MTYLFLFLATYLLRSIFHVLSFQVNSSLSPLTEEEQPIDFKERFAHKLAFVYDGFLILIWDYFVGKELSSFAKIFHQFQDKILQ